MNTQDAIAQLVKNSTGYRPEVYLPNVPESRLSEVHAGLKLGLDFLNDHARIDRIAIDHDSGMDKNGTLAATDSDLSTGHCELYLSPAWENGAVFNLRNNEDNSLKWSGPIEEAFKQGDKVNKGERATIADTLADVITHECGHVGYAYSASKSWMFDVDVFLYSEVVVNKFREYGENAEYSKVIKDLETSVYAIVGGPHEWLAECFVDTCKRGYANVPRLTQQGFDIVRHGEYR
jgi:hypothetical protein